MFSKPQFKLTLLALVVSVLVYAWLGYGPDRTYFLGYFAGMVMAFICYVILYRSIPTMRFGYVFIGAICLRLIFLFSTPHLSDDYHRYIWDGELIVSGQSPYEYVPTAVPDSTRYAIDPEGQLLAEMNSPDYYSVYPPLHQGIFLLAAWLGKSTAHAALVMRLILVFAEGLFILFLYQIGLRINRPKAVLLYAFNPLIITEISGNLHFEGIVAFFLIAALYALHIKRHALSGLLLGTAAAVKLTPFIYFPAIFKLAADRGKGFRWGVMVVIAFVLAGWWIFPLDQWLRLGTSIGLYFQSFEFNASFYYLARGVGMLWLGYNPIAATGWLLPLTGMIVILTVSFFGNKAGLERSAGRMVIIGTVYLLFATTVHPWYLIPVIALSVISRFTFPIVWSFLIALSYSAYSNPGYTENGWLLSIEYAVALTWFLLELVNPKLIDSWNRKIWGETP